MATKTSNWRTGSWRHNMALGRENARVRILAVERMIQAEQKISSYEIQRRLERLYGIKSAIKTILDDLNAIDRFIPLKASKGGNGGFQKCDFSEVEDGK